MSIHVKAADTDAHFLTHLHQTHTMLIHPDASDPIDFTIDEGDDSEGDEVPDSDLVEEPANDLDHPLWGIDRKGRRFRYMKKSAAARE